MPQPEPSPASPGGGPADTLPLLFATMFPQAAVAMMSLSPPVFAEAAARSLGYPAELAGLYTGVVYGFVLLGNLLSSPLIDRFGALRLSFACVVGAAGGLALFGWGGPAGILVGTVLIGAFYGPLTPASAQAISRRSGSPGFALIVSIRQTSVPMGGVLAGLLVPPLLIRVGWNHTCVVLAVASAVASAVFAASSKLIRAERPRGRSVRRRNLLEPLRLVLRQAALLRLSCASAIFGAVQLVLSSFLVVYLTSVVGHDLVSAGALLSASQVAGILGRPAWGYLADWSRSARLVLFGLGVGMALSCGLVAALPLVGPSWLSLPVALLFGATGTGWNGVFLAEIMRNVEPGEVGLATSGGLLFTYGGIVFAPPAFGALAAAVGFVAAFGVLALLAGAGALLLIGNASRPLDGGRRN